MTTQEAITRIFEQKEDADFQVVLQGVTLASEHVYINSKRDDPEESIQILLNKFGKQDWEELRFDGRKTRYCPKSIAKELKRELCEMYNYFKYHSCE